MAGLGVVKVLAKIAPHSSRCHVRNLSVTNRMLSAKINKSIGTEESSSQIDSLEEMAGAVTLTDLDQFREPMEPFMKEMFAGKFNKIVFSYPNVLTNDRYHYLENKIIEMRTTFSDNKDLIDRIGIDKRISKNIQLSLRSQGLFGLRGLPNHGGEGYGMTESLRLMEEVAYHDLNLSNVIANSSWFAGEAILSCENELLKEKYLPRIYGGLSMCSMCVKDENSGSSPRDTNVQAVENADGTFTLNGLTTWITGAKNAELFVVAAKVQEKGLTALLVDSKETSGIKVDKSSTYAVEGLKASGIGSVTFENASVPRENLLCQPGDGEEFIDVALNTEAKLVGSIQMLSGLRRALNLLIQHANKTTVLGADLSSFALINSKISQCCIHFYALESAIYMTAGLADFQQEPDISVEATACRLLSRKTLQLLNDAAKSILGASSYLSDNNIMQILKDVEGLGWWYGTEELDMMYISLECLQHAGPQRQTFMDKIRGNPIYQVIGSTWESKEKHKFKESIHHSLSYGAISLEECFLAFEKTVLVELSRHASNIQHEDMALTRLSLIGTYLYAVTSVLARASKAYCDGHAHAQLDAYNSLAYVGLMEPEIRKLIQGSQASGVNKLDGIIGEIGGHTLKNNRYLISHPLKRNMF